MKLAALMSAIGDGRRQHASQSRPQPLLDGRPVLAHTLERLDRCSRIEDIYPVVSPLDVAGFRDHIVAPGKFTKVKEVLEGGVLRQDFIHKALLRLGPRYDLIMLHDGFRPLVPDELLTRVIAAAEVHGAAIAAVPVHDTIKAISRDGFVSSSYDRRRLRNLQTPMVFRYDILIRALEQAARENYYGSDESVLVERLGEKIKVVAGSRLNIYVASREDFLLAKALLRVEQERQKGGQTGELDNSPEFMPATDGGKGSL